MHWKIHKQSCPLIVIKSIEGKGLGIVSTRNIPAGTILIREDPIIVHEGGSSKLDDFLKKFINLDASEKFKYMNLYDPEEKSNVVRQDIVEKLPEIDQSNWVFKIWRIFYANSILVSEKQGVRAEAVYPTVSRINHSCKANVVFGLDEHDDSKMVITACRDIVKNEELLLNYIGPILFSDRKERQSELRKGWCFECCCEICLLSGEELEVNERIRQEIRDIASKIQSCVEPSLQGTLKAFSLGKKKLKLMDLIQEEALLSIPFALMDCYGQAKAVEFFGGKVDVDPSMYKARAAELCSVLGPSARAVCKEMEEVDSKLLTKWKSLREI